MLRTLSILLVCAKIFAWSPDYKESLETARLEDKPLLVAFLGADWCPWSDKILEDVLTKPEFASALKDSVVFVRVDFPYTGARQESEALKEKYHIQQLPTLVLVSPEEEEITKVGYQPLQASEFAAHIERILHGYQKLVQKMNQTDVLEMSTEELRYLYRESCAYQLVKYKESLFLAGLAKDPGSFFLLEKYAQLIKTQPKKAKAVREEIEKRDKENKEGAHLQLAIFDFQERAESSDNVDKVLKPLKKYIKEFGSKDHENVWRVHMMIAQYLFHKHEKKEEIIKHAQASIDLAPEETKAELTEFLAYMKGNLQ